jgi:uncharacterized membrane protein
VVVAALAASAVANAVMLFSLSMVKIVVIFVSPWPRSARLMSWITLVALEGKAILL